MVHINETIAIRSFSTKLAEWVKETVPLLRILYTP